MNTRNLKLPQDATKPRSASEVKTTFFTSESDRATGRSPEHHLLDLWGQDIALDASGEALVAANGELVLTEGVDTGVQDIKLRLFTYMGTLFYDTEFGSRLMDWVLEENTEENRAAFIAEVIMRIEADPRVVPHTVTAAVLKWDGNTFITSANWHFIEDDQPYNLILQYNKTTKELVISDARPTTNSLSTHIS